MLIIYIPWNLLRINSARKQVNMDSDCMLNAILFSSLMADDMSLMELFDALFLVVKGYSWSYRPQGGAEEAFLHVAGFREGWRWGPSGDGRKLQGEVLMGKRQMACQWQKWSCAGESAGANEREDGRKGWLINLFTSLKTLQAPFWLKFHLPSIITNARSSYWSCQHQMLDPPLPHPGPERPEQPSHPGKLSQTLWVSSSYASLSPLPAVLLSVWLTGKVLLYCISRSLLQCHTLATPGF